MKVYLLLGLWFFCLAGLRAQGEGGLVNWLTFEEAQEKNKTVKKPFIIDVYTDWCGWCKHMMKTTYSDPNIAGYINQNFYPVKFNAETKDTIEYNGKKYVPLSPEPKTPHELALKFLGEKLSYPSTLFITNNFEFNMLTQGYLEVKAIEPFLVFMTENAWQNSVYDEFAPHFKHTFTDTNFRKFAVKTVDITELEKLMKKKPKKVIVSLNAPFSNTGKVMEYTTFCDSAVASYINKYFYFVKFDVTRDDTIQFKGEKFFKTNASGFPLHMLAFRLSGNRFALPTVAILNEQLETIDALNFYQSPERVRPIVEFIGKDLYKTQKYQDFIQEYIKRPKKSK